VLAFHGTGADRALVDKLFAEGFVPHARPWAHDATGIERHVFACTQPIGTRGGDPIEFAQRSTWHGRRAYLFVFDLDDSVVVHGAVPNEELERWWKVRTFAQLALDRRLFAHARAERRPIRELLRYRVKQVAEDLVDGEPDAHTLVQFEAAYHRARASQKARIARSYNLRIPAWFADDSHYPDCMGCLYQLFEVDIEVPGVPGVAFGRGAWDRLDLTTLGQLLDITDRWLAHAGDPAVDTLAELQRHAPPRTVPRHMCKDFVTADLDERMRGDDTQLLLGHVPPARIVGAIDVGERDRLSPLVRPVRGQTLLGNLRHFTRELVDRRKRSSKPILLA
jgi:hypothetical protein